MSGTYGRSAPANGDSDAPDLSADGSFVAFRSTATNLVSGATNGLPSIFLYDVTNSVTLLASVNRFGTGAGDNRCLVPVFSGDGSVVVFGSWASDLAANDFNGLADLFLLSPYASSVIPLFSLQATAGAAGQRPTLTWPVMSGKTYRVQYRDSLTGYGLAGPARQPHHRGQPGIHQRSGGLGLATVLSCGGVLSG